MNYFNVSVSSGGATNYAASDYGLTLESPLATSATGEKGLTLKKNAFSSFSSSANPSDLYESGELITASSEKSKNANALVLSTTTLLRFLLEDTHFNFNGKPMQIKFKEYADDVSFQYMNVYYSSVKTASTVDMTLFFKVTDVGKILVDLSVENDVLKAFEIEGHNVGGSVGLYCYTRSTFVKMANGVTRQINVDVYDDDSVVVNDGAIASDGIDSFVNKSSGRIAQIEGLGLDENAYDFTEAYVQAGLACSESEAPEPNYKAARMITKEYYDLCRSQYSNMTVSFADAISTPESYTVLNSYYIWIDANRDRIMYKVPGEYNGRQVIREEVSKLYKLVDGTYYKYENEQEGLVVDEDETLEYYKFAHVLEGLEYEDLTFNEVNWNYTFDASKLAPRFSEGYKTGSLVFEYNKLLLIELFGEGNKVRCISVNEEEEGFYFNVKGNHECEVNEKTFNALLNFKFPQKVHVHERKMGDCGFVEGYPKDYYGSYAYENKVDLYTVNMQGEPEFVCTVDDGDEAEALIFKKLLKGLSFSSFTYVDDRDNHQGKYVYENPDTSANVQKIEIGFFDFKVSHITAYMNVSGETGVAFHEYTVEFTNEPLA